MEDRTEASVAHEKPQKEKTRRQTQACDACRARKVKCDRSPQDENRVGMASPSKCGPCRALGIQCTFTYAPKKRGPQVKYLQRTAGTEGSHPPGISDEHGSGDNATSSPLTTRVKSSPYPPNPTRQEISSPYVTTTSYYRSVNVPGAADRGTLAEQHAMHAHALERQGVPLAIFKSIDVERDWEPHLLMTLEATRPGGKAYLPYLQASMGDGTEKRGSGSPSGPATLAEAGPSKSAIETSSTEPVGISSATAPRSRSLLDSTIPRWRLLRIIELFFEYVATITPSVDQNRLMSDLRDERDTRQGELVWSGMVLAIAAHTLAQLPACLVPLSNEERGRLLGRCRRAADSSLADLETPSIERYSTVITLAHLSWTYRIIGKTLTARGRLGAAWALATDFGIHDRKPIQALPLAEASLHRRAFWLLSTLDKTLVTVEDTYPIIPSGICVDPYQEAIEDDYDKAVNEGMGDEPPDEPKGEIVQRLINQLLSIIGSVKTWSHRDGVRWSSSTLAESKRGVEDANTAFLEIAKVIDDWSWFGLGDHSTKRNSAQDLDEQMKDVKRLFTDPDFVSDAFKRPEAVHNIQYVLALAAAQCALHRHLDRILEPLTNAELVSMTDTKDGMMAGPLTPALKSAIEARARSDTPSWPDTVARNVAWVLMETSMQVICLHHATLEPLLQMIAKTILQYPLADATSTMAASSEARDHLVGYARNVSELAGVRTLHSAGNSSDGQ